MSVIERYAGLVLDLDGVIVRGDEVLKEAASFLKRLRRQGIPHVYVTNNSSRRPDEWVQRFVRAKVEVDEDQVLTSASAAARLLATDPRPRCLVIGETGLTSALRGLDIPIVEDPGEAEVVVVGWDRQLTYDKLRRAALAISKGARFVATNPDPVYPAAEGPWPGNGATIAYLRAVTDVAPEVVGKPQTGLFELAKERLGVDGKILVVGDQVATDVVAADRMGWDAALVLTGVSSYASLVGSKAKPAWLVTHVGDLDGPEPPIVRHARESDLSAIHDLLDTADFDVTGAARRLRNTLVAEGPGEQVVGTASWELLDNAAHLRAITVVEAERGHGTASHLVVRSLDELQRAGVEWVYLLTPGADALFSKLGFWEVSRDRVPAEVLGTAQFGAPATGATAFVRRLRPST